MQARSALFDATIAGAHRVIVRADILVDGNVAAAGVPIADGSVSGSRKQFARRTCTAVIADPSLRPLGLPTDLLAPYGNEIRLWRGAVTPAGPELMCLGTFGIRSVEFDVAGDFDGMTITGIDRSKVLAETRFAFPYSTTTGYSAIGLIKLLIREALPNVEVYVAPGTRDALIPPVVWMEDRDKAITDLLASAGAEGFFDPYGTFVIQPVPVVNSAPVYTVKGGPGGVLVSARHSLSRDDVINAVVARGANTDPDVTAVVSNLIVDSDPSSPTYYYGRFGKIVGYYDSSLLMDKLQADNAARAALANQVGAARSINYSQLVNPALELGDVVAVVDPDTGVTELHLQDELTIPLSVDGTMSAQTRSFLADFPPSASTAPVGTLS